MQQVANGKHTQAQPDAEGIEGTCIDIITLTRLVGCGIEIYNQRNTHHHKEQHHHYPVAPVAVELIDKTHQTEQQRQEEVGVAGRVIGHRTRQLILRTSEILVDKADARQPSTVQVETIFILLQLHIILTSHKVPHKVAPEHITHLVAKKVAYILAESRLSTLNIGGIPLTARIVPHTREEVHSLRRILVVIEDDTLLILLGRGVKPRHSLIFDRLGGRVAILVRNEIDIRSIRLSVVVIYGRKWLRRVVWTPQQRAVAVLVAVEHTEQHMRI